MGAGQDAQQGGGAVGTQQGQGVKRLGEAVEQDSQGQQGRDQQESPGACPTRQGGQADGHHQPVAEEAHQEDDGVRGRAAWMAEPVAQVTADGVPQAADEHGDGVGGPAFEDQGLRKGAVRGGVDAVGAEDAPGRQADQADGRV